MYYRKGLYKEDGIHVKQCMKCTQQNLHPQHYAQLHLEVPSMLMHFSAMDLVSRFKLSPQGHQYALIIIE